MNTIIVWILVIVGGRDVTLSVPISDYESCRSLQRAVNEMIPYKGTKRTECVKVNILK